MCLRGPSRAAFRETGRPGTRTNEGSWSILRRMRFRKRRGQAISLLLACHPLPAAAMTVALTIAAALSGRSGVECLLVAATVFESDIRAATREGERRTHIESPSVKP